MKKIDIKPLNLEIVTKTPVIDIRYDKSNERLIFDIDQQELNHKYLQGTGGDPHPQYLDMIRHRGMDHEFLTEYLDKRYIHSHDTPIKYFFERYDVNIEPGCFGYTILPGGDLEISNLVIATRSEPSKLKLDILYNGTSIFAVPVEDMEFYVSSYGKSRIYKGNVMDTDAAVTGFGLLEVVILEAEDVNDLFFRIEFR